LIRVKSNFDDWKCPTQQNFISQEITTYFLKNPYFRNKLQFSFRHQVSTSKESKDRQSIAFFVNFDHESIVTPIKNLEAHPINSGKMYSAVQSGEYVRGRLNNTIEK
jgi:hypothetical protein